MQEELFYRFMAGVAGAFVERQSLDDALQAVGLSEEEILGQAIAPQSSPAAIAYARESLAETRLKFSVKEGERLYLVKKVLCSPEEYDWVAGAVSGEPTDKFQVLRVIGQDRGLLHYKQRNPGLEAYLANGATPIEALRKTAKDDPLLTFTGKNIDPCAMRTVDELLTKAFYVHSPEAVERYFTAISELP